jgi:hypothetical protein
VMPSRFTSFNTKLTCLAASGIVIAGRSSGIIS